MRLSSSARERLAAVAAKTSLNMNDVLDLVLRYVPEQELITLIQEVKIEDAEAYAAWSRSRQ